jgi:hypothetical protein
MSKPTATFTKAASALLTPSPVWEGTTTIGERRYCTFLVGDKSFNTYTLDLASGRARLQLTVRKDGSWLSRRGDARGWTTATTQEIAIAHAVVLGAASAERSAKSSRLQTGVWVRATAMRALLIAVFAFTLLALA